MEILRIVHKKKASIGHEGDDEEEDHHHRANMQEPKPPASAHKHSTSISTSLSGTTDRIDRNSMKPSSMTPFRRCHSQPENPTSDIGLLAIQADRNERDFNQDKLLLLRKFSVCERDIVICNRVRRGINPQWFKDRERMRSSYRSFNVESRRREYTLGAITNRVASAAERENHVEASAVETIRASSGFPLPPAPPKPPASSKTFSSPGLPVPPPSLRSISRSSQLSVDADLAFHSSSSNTLTPKEREMLGKYLIHESFAKGSYGKVWSAQNIPTHQEVAVKIVPKRMLVSSEEQQSVIYEHIIHQDLDHPNIIKLIECFEDEGAYYFIQELAQHGNLKDILTPLGLEEDICRHVARQLLLALEYLHKQHIIHHDVKPENILLNADNEVKLCDFGAARAFGQLDDHVQFMGVFGTSGYIAPELLTAENRYNCAVDIYSSGVLLFEMALGYAPFYPPSNCIQAPLEFPSNCTTSPDLIELLCLMMHRDQAKRITASAALRHKWFRTHSGENDSTANGKESNKRSLARAVTMGYPDTLQSHHRASRRSPTLPSSPTSSRYARSI